jgi:hypothetical protein
VNILPRGEYLIDEASPAYRPLNQMAAIRETAPWGWQAFFEGVNRFVQSSESQFGDYASQAYTEYVLDRLEVITEHVTLIRDRLLQAGQALQSQEERSTLRVLIELLGDVLQSLPHLIRKWRQHLDALDIHTVSSRYQVPVQQLLGPGRPRLQVTQEQLYHLRSLSFSWTGISRILGISRMTLHRRRVEYGMSTEPIRSITDDQLMALVHQLRHELPEVGQSILRGRVRAMGLQVARSRLREAIRMSDPLNTALRWPSLTNRRPYSVPGPNSLWHVGKTCFL